MTQRRVRARSASSARKKAEGKNTSVVKVNFIPGTARSGKKTYAVTTKRKR